MFAANLKPNDTLRARYDMNSISINNGKRGKGVPAGTNKEKNTTPCLAKPKIVAPKTIVKDKANVNANWLVLAKLYGLLGITYSYIKLDYILTT
jgi:hypothetical protein